MKKRIISFMICLALLISAFVVGSLIIDRKADSLEDNTGRTAGISEQILREDLSAPTIVGTQESLLSYNGEYILTGDVTITKANAATNATYQALLDVFEGPACHTFTTLNVPSLSRTFSHTGKQNSGGVTTGLHTAAP